MFWLFFVILLIAFTAYAILRYKFLDIRIVVQRSFLYSVTMAATATIYFGIFFAAGEIFRQKTDLADSLSAIGAAIIVVVSFPNFEKFFRKKTDRFFFKDKYDYAEALQKLSEILNHNLDLNDLLTKVCQTLKEIFRTQQAEVVLGNLYDRQLSVNPNKSQTYKELSLPIIMENDPVGFVAVGLKLSGDVYDGQDVKLLTTFANQAAVAIKKAELYEKIKEYARELETRVEERTAEIKSLQEEQKQMMLDISHALQTPLTVLKGELEAAEHRKPSRKLNTLGRSIDETSKFIYDLLNLAKLEQQKLRFEKLNFSQLLSGVIEYFAVLARERGIAVASRIQKGIHILGQKDKLEELVTNLLSNSMKYVLDKKEKKIWINLEGREGVVKLIVTDNGIGISPADLPHIFDRFYQVRNRNNVRTKGGGLGLAIAKKIIEKHNGMIEVESQPGQGTKFIITFNK